MKSKPGSSASRAPHDPMIQTVGSGPPLVFVPGMDGTGGLFYRQAPLLARHYTVSTFRLRDDARSMDDLVADLDVVASQVAPDGQKLTLVGESFGGTLSLQYALAHPQRLDALVILNSFAFFAPRMRLRLAIAGLTVLPWGAMQLVRKLTAFRMHSKHTHRSELARFLEITRTTTKPGYIGRLRILTRYDMRSRLSEIQVPTLFLAAEQDHLVPAVEQARLMAEPMPDATIRTLPGHGHICMIAPGFDLAEIISEWQRARGAATAPSGRAAPSKE
jgi:pimeloyl-ACP methyl ester carboxylesterase